IGWCIVQANVRAREAKVKQSKAVVFSEDGLRKIQEHIEQVRLDLGAVVALLMDDAGELLTDCGWRGDFDINAFLALVSNEMSAANAVVHLLRDDAAFDLHYHEGQKYEMYTVRISDQVFLTLIFESRQATSGRVGMVWLTLRRTIAELRKLLQRAIIKPGSAENHEMHRTVSAVLDEALQQLDTDSFLKPKTAETPPPKTEEPPAPKTEAPRPRLLRRRASTDSTDDAKRVLSYDEARALGLIGDDDARQ
ncbi:MAG: hypothetical protein N2559_11570, partial [Anaerolineae bacterium]|nr:hypothetical protein [Anaerolineae bacterium]